MNLMNTKEQKISLLADMIAFAIVDGECFGVLHEPCSDGLDLLHLHVVVQLGDLYFFLLDKAVHVRTISIHQ